VYGRTTALPAHTDYVRMVFERRGQLTGHRIQCSVLLCELLVRVLGPAAIPRGTSWHGVAMLSRHRAARARNTKSRAFADCTQPLYDYTDHRVYLSWADIVNTNLWTVAEAKAKLSR